MIAVGDKVWLEAIRGRGLGHDREIEITKVGRKWVYFGANKWERFDKSTGDVDGGGYSSPGRVWASREACEDDRVLSTAWGELREAMRFTRPEGVTYADVMKARRLLGLDS